MSSVYPDSHLQAADVTLTMDQQQKLAQAVRQLTSPPIPHRLPTQRRTYRRVLPPSCIYVNRSGSTLQMTLAKAEDELPVALHHVGPAGGDYGYYNISCGDQRAIADLIDKFIAAYPLAFATDTSIALSCETEGCGEWLIATGWGRDSSHLVFGPPEFSDAWKAAPGALPELARLLRSPATIAFDEAE